MNRQSVSFVYQMQQIHSIQREFTQKVIRLAEQILRRSWSWKKDTWQKRNCGSLSGLDIKALAAKLDVGEVTLKDIIETLQRPNRDPRDDYPQPLLKADVLDMKDLI